MLSTEQRVPAPTARAVVARLRDAGDMAHAATAQRFFQAGPGGYAAGDRFLGIRVPTLRKLVSSCVAMAPSQLQRLLHSPWHEARLLALLILVRQFRHGDLARRRAIYDLYLDNTRYINNWDLVDSSAPYIVGEFLTSRSHAPLRRLARSASLWERRIAIMATFRYVRQGEFTTTLGIARELRGDPEPLIHKAVGWMLREIAKRDAQVAVAFLKRYYAEMPRTSLRYAIERFAPPLRQRYLRGQF